MKESITLTLPESLDDISIRQLAQYMASDLESEDKAVRSALRIFAGIDTETQKRAVRKQLNEVAEQLIKVLNDKPTLKTTFEYKGVKWGFVPNIDEISAGEYIDAESYMGDWSQMHKAVAVLYRPVTKEGKGWYQIKSYEGSDKYSGMLQDAPASVAVGMLLFFWTIANELLSATITSLEQRAKDAGLMPNLSLLTDGAGILPSSSFRAETFSYLTKLLSYQYISS